LVDEKEGVTEIEIEEKEEIMDVLQKLKLGGMKEEDMGPTKRKITEDLNRDASLMRPKV